MSKEINLLNNGRLFPSWVLANFKKYKLEPLYRDANKDPCQQTKMKKELHLYQKFLSAYLSYNSPFKDLLIYHGYGSGKTVSAINIYNVLFNHTPNWNLFILIKAALKDDPWMRDLNDWLGKDDNKKRWGNIHFIHYDSPIADRQFLEIVKQTDSSKQSFYIIEEAHNFIRNVYNNISSRKGKRAQVIYDYIQQEKRENYNTRIVMITADPAVNSAYELALMFNLLRPDTFPDTEAYFNQIYISSTNFHSLNKETKNMFQRRIMGLVSYYIGATPDKYAKKIVHYKNITMEKYFEEVYNHYEEIEERLEKIRRRFQKGKVGDTSSTYASYTRQASNFVFPPISDEINGETRPRPGKFRISETEANKLDENKDKDKREEIVKNNEAFKKYNEALKLFIKETFNYFKQIMKKDKSKKYTLEDDIKTFSTKYNGKFKEFHNNEKRKSLLYKALYNSSPKMVTCIFYILKSPGPVLFYSNYVNAEGLQIFKLYLSFFGFLYLFDDKDFDEKNLKNKNRKDFYRYIEFHGAINRKIRTNNKKIFNSPENKKGRIAKIIMISPAGSEGISLKNVRQVHILEPYWNEVRIEQMIGRAIRQCSHKDLPLRDRTVDVYRYKMVRKNKKETTDEKMEEISRKKNSLVQSFLEAMREVAVDCELFKTHNMMATEYKCFKFNEESLFQDPIGPAYSKKLEYDMKFDNGSNSKNSIRVKIKVRKIKAVKELEGGTYSDADEYWINDDTGIIYNLELNYPAGKIKKDVDGNLVKLKNNIYVIENLINIPMSKIFI